MVVLLMLVGWLVRLPIGRLSATIVSGEGQSEPIDLQHYLQQPCAFRLRLGFGYASASLRGLIFTPINH